jgi:hypothetical protein
VPTTPLTVTPTVRAEDSPTAIMHTSDVDDAHAAVPQLLYPTVAVGVRAPMLKLTPDTVTL